MFAIVFNKDYIDSNGNGTILAVTQTHDEATRVIQRYVSSEFIHLVPSEKYLHIEEVPLVTPKTAIRHLWTFYAVLNPDGKLVDDPQIGPDVGPFTAIFSNKHIMDIQRHIDTHGGGTVLVEGTNGDAVVATGNKQVHILKNELTALRLGL